MDRMTDTVRLFVERLERVSEEQDAWHAAANQTLARIHDRLGDLEELAKRLGTMINNVHGRLNSLETQIANLALRDATPRATPSPYQAPYQVPVPFPSDAYRDWLRRVQEAGRTAQQVAGGAST